MFGIAHHVAQRHLLHERQQLQRLRGLLLSIPRLTHQGCIGRPASSLLFQCLYARSLSLNPRFNLRELPGKLSLTPLLPANKQRSDNHQKHDEQGRATSTQYVAPWPQLSNIKIDLLSASGHRQIVPLPVRSAPPITVRQAAFRSSSTQSGASISCHISSAATGVASASVRPPKICAGSPPRGAMTIRLTASCAI